jgi:hypothetical protein
MRISHSILLTAALTVLNIDGLVSQQMKVLSKDEVTALYKKLYESSKIESMPWKGNEEKCECGELEASIYKKVEDRINFFRIVSGLSEVKINPTFNFEAQSAAFLSKVNNRLTHSPDKEMTCYSESAQRGCRKSCLGLSYPSYFSETGMVTGFIKDLGSNNYYVGHRRWILYTKLAEVGYGATDRSEALLTIDGISKVPTNTPEYIAYPWNGYVPVNLIFPRWSFSIPENKTVDFSAATITMADSQGVPIAIEKEPFKSLLDPTLVWTVTGLFNNSDMTYGTYLLEEGGFLNQKIRVLIKNVKVDGVIKQYEYFVEPIKL